MALEVPLKAKKRFPPLAPPPAVEAKAAEPEAPSAYLTPTEVSDVKREIKRLSNKRALMTASRLAGSSQDDELKACEKTCTRAEAEIARWVLRIASGPTR